jgi:type III restriction enzyme
VDLPSQLGSVEREVEYERAATGERVRRKTTVTVRMFTSDEVAAHVYQRLRSIDQETADQKDPKQRTSYAKKYGLSWCRKMVRESVRRAGEKNGMVSEENRQKILQALGPLQRGIAKSVRYRLRVEQVYKVSTTNRPANSVSLNVLRRADASIFYGPDSRSGFHDQELSIFDEATGSDSELPRKAVQRIDNGYCVKTPLNIVIAQHDPERRFLRKLFEKENAEKLDAWVKSTDRDFYAIEYSWKKGEHTKRASFNPDFFIKIGDRIFVVEIKDDSEITDPSEENGKKDEFASEHFRRVNEEQDELTFQINFLTPRDYDAFFQKLRNDDLGGYRSHLDAALAQ